MPAQMSIHMSVHVCTCLYMCPRTCQCTCLYTCMHPCRHTCACIRLCTCLYTRLCACLRAIRSHTLPSVGHGLHRCTPAHVICTYPYRSSLLPSPVFQSRIVRPQQKHATRSCRHRTSATAVRVGALASAWVGERAGGRVRDHATARLRTCDEEYGMHLADSGCSKDRG